MIDSASEVVLQVIFTPGIRLLTKDPRLTPDGKPADVSLIGLPVPIREAFCRFGGFVLDVLHLHCRRGNLPVDVFNRGIECEIPMNAHCLMPAIVCRLLKMA